ncbi:MAG TPA: GntR family transcriptional regulator [Solirubrobacteraceae bacterium]|nr:GntR family transcriptional regulator [Solirubrobacteraceae bacterium]
MRGFKPRPAVAAPDRTPAASRAYGELRRRILHGELGPGTILTEAETAELLGVSRTPLREAMRELLNEGLCEEGSRRQVVVAAPSAAVNREVAILRRVLECLASREAAGRRDDSDLDQLHLIMIRTRRAIAAADLNAYLDCDDDFHQRIARIAGPHLIEDAVRRLRGLTRLAALHRPLGEEDLRRSADQHDAIISALESADADLAERAMDRHLIASELTLGVAPAG